MLQISRPGNLLKRDPITVFSCEYCKVFSKIIGERLLFYFFNGSLLHWPKGSRSRLYDGVGLQGLTHRSSFLFLSWHEQVNPPTCVRKSKRNTFDESVVFILVIFGLITWYYLVFRSSQVVLGCFRSSFLSLVSTNFLNLLTNPSLSLHI